MSKKSKRSLAVFPGVKTEFNPDYTPVRRDLKRIGILAAIFIAILIVLAIFQDSLMALIIR